MMYFLIHDAAKNRGINIIKHFEENKINLEDPDEYGETPFHHAVYFGHSDLVNYLIGKKVDVNVQDNIGSSALHRACWHGHMNIIGLLKNNQIDLNAQDDYGRTALHYAVMNGQLEIVKYLEKNEANLIVYDGYGNSLLDFANVEKRNDLIKYLSERSYDFENKYVSNTDDVIKSMFDERMLCRITSLRGVHLLNQPVKLECSHAVCLRCIFDIMGQVYLDKMKSSEKASCCFKHASELLPEQILYDTDFDFYKETVFGNFENHAKDMLECLIVIRNILKKRSIEIMEIRTYEYIEEEIDIRVLSLKHQLDGLKNLIDCKIQKIQEKCKKLFKKLDKKKKCSAKKIFIMEYIGLIASFQMESKGLMKKDICRFRLLPLPIPGFRISGSELKLQEKKFFVELYQGSKRKIAEKYNFENFLNN